MPYVGRTPSAVPVTADDIPANSIDASKIVDGSIELAEIADNSITDAKLNSAKLNGIEAGATNYIHPTTHATADIADNAITDAKLNSAKLNGIEAGATADQTKADIEGLGIAASSITGALPAIDGSALTSLTSSQMPAGSIIQTVQGVMTSPWSGSTTTLVPVGLTVAITTVSANSKVLVRCAFRAQMTGGANKGGHFALRSSLDSYASNLTTSLMINDWASWNQEAGALEYLHTTSAASGSTITYKLYGGDSRYGSALYVNDTWGYSGVESRITAQEIKT